MAVLSGIDFFTVEVLTWRGLVTYFMLFVIKWRRQVSSLPASRGTLPKNAYNGLLGI